MNGLYLDCWTNVFFDEKRLLMRTSTRHKVIKWHVASSSKKTYQSVSPKSLKFKRLLDIGIYDFGPGPGRKLRWPRSGAGAIFNFRGRGLVGPGSGGVGPGPGPGPRSFPGPGVQCRGRGRCRGGSRKNFGGGGKNFFSQKFFIAKIAFLDSPDTVKIVFTIFRLKKFFEKKNFFLWKKNVFCAKNFFFLPK